MPKHELKLSLSDSKLNRDQIIDHMNDPFYESDHAYDSSEVAQITHKPIINHVLDNNDLLLSHRSIKNVTVQAYFDDPLLPYRMREVIMMAENRPLLLQYETSLPSWAVVMATYAYYQPWFRKFQYWFMMVLSLVTMMIGCFDLYKNIPYFREF